MFYIGEKNNVLRGKIDGGGTDKIEETPSIFYPKKVELEEISD